MKLPGAEGFDWESTKEQDYEITTLPSSPRGFQEAQSISRQARPSLLKALVPSAQTHLSTSYNQGHHLQGWGLGGWSRRGGARRERSPPQGRVYSDVERSQHRLAQTASQPSYHGNRKRQRPVKHDAPIKVYWAAVAMEPSHKHT